MLEPGGLIFVTYLITPNKDVGNSQKARDFYQCRPYFYTDAPEEALSLIRGSSIELVDHFSSDGISLRIPNFVNEMTEQQFEKWLSFHRSICRDDIVFRFVIHGVIVARKPDMENQTAGVVR